MPAAIRPFTNQGGWVAPNGAFWQCDDYHHHHCAASIAYELDLNHYAPDGGYVGAERRLELAGFVHLSLGCAYFQGRELTQAQRDVLFDLAMQYGGNWGDRDNPHGIWALLRGPDVHELNTPSGYYESEYGS